MNSKIYSLSPISVKLWWVKQWWAPLENVAMCQSCSNLVPFPPREEKVVDKKIRETVLAILLQYNLCSLTEILDLFCHNSVCSLSSEILFLIASVLKFGPLFSGRLKPVYLLLLQLFNCRVIKPSTMSHKLSALSFLLLEIKE